MGVGVDAEGAAEGLEDHAEEVPRVEADERDQQQVERVPHLIPTREDWHWFFGFQKYTHYFL